LTVKIQSDNLRVVLVSARNPLNIGAAARAMSNFGFLRLGVVNPYEVAFRKAKSAVGAAALLEQAEEYKSVAEAVADCTLVVGTTAVRHRELQHPLRRLEYGARLIRKRLQSSRVALLFGSEKYGLSRRDLSHCHWLMRIPTRDEHILMNLGQAVAICLYELIRDDRVAGAQRGLRDVHTHPASGAGDEPGLLPTTHVAQPFVVWWRKNGSSARMNEPSAMLRRCERGLSLQLRKHGLAGRESPC